MVKPPEFQVHGVTTFNVNGVDSKLIITWLEWHGDMFMARGRSSDMDLQHALRCYRSAWDLAQIWSGHEETRTRLAEKVSAATRGRDGEET